MKKKKIVFLLCIMLFVSIGIFLIYKLTYEEKYNYVVLGDSLAAGRNPYGVIDYGYTDYVKDFLKSQNKLESYISYAKSGYTINDIKDDINFNREIIVNNKRIGLKKALRESDVVTISIGANDFLSEIGYSNISQLILNENMMLEKINDIILELSDLFDLVKRYAKGEIIVIGYYNPLPHLDKYQDNINKIIEVADDEYKKLCTNKDIHYVKISHKISKNSDYLPNPLDIHLNKEGYKIIANEVISLIKRDIFD